MMNDGLYHLIISIACLTLACLVIWLNRDTELAYTLVSFVAGFWFGRSSVPAKKE